MDKKRVIKSIENVSEEVMEAIKKKYPDGWNNHVQRINKGNGEFFHAITVDTIDTSYMIKVNVKVDSLEDLEKFANQEDFGSDEGGESDVAESVDIAESEESSDE